MGAGGAVNGGSSPCVIIIRLDNGAGGVGQGDDGVLVIFDGVVGVGGGVVGEGVRS